jgi:hypothetical protein
MCNQNPALSHVATSLRPSDTARCAAPASPLEGLRGKASASLRLSSLGRPESPHRPCFRDLRGPAPDWRLRISARMQDALDDTRSALADDVALAPATSSFACAVSRWLASSRWLHLGPYRPRRSILQCQVRPDPLADALHHLGKVTLAVLLRGCLLVMRSSWKYRNRKLA